MKRTILIIEDDIIFSRSISNWLRKNNMETECVAQLSSARRKLSSGEYDRRGQAPSDNRETAGKSG